MSETVYTSVRRVSENFSFEQYTGNDESLNRPIYIADTNRPGLELTGYFDKTQLKRIVILGEKETAYIRSMSEEAQQRSFEFLTSEETPAIIITKGNACPKVLKEIAQRKNFPVFLSKVPTTRMIVNLSAFLDEELAESKSLHGCLLSIYGKGVLLTGESGMGKSEIALELIKRGHLLVADDRVDCYRVHNKIFGKSPDLLKEMLEIRGIGIINVSRMFGVSSVLPRTEVDFEIRLETWHSDENYDRVGIEEKIHENILGIDIPKIVVPVREGRSMAVIIESAVTNFLLGERGLDSAKEFERRVLEYIESNRVAMDKQKG